MADSATEHRHDDTEESATDDPTVLQAQLEVLEAENARLRREYTRARQSQYHRAAIGLGVLGLVALLGAAVLSTQRTVLLALGGTGLFGGLLTHYLTPERFVPATVNERLHEAHTATRAALVDELGLQRTQIYVPTPDQPTPARLFVPQQTDYTVPETLEQLLVVTADPAERGVAFVPTGGPLYELFETTRTGPPVTDDDVPRALADQLADAVVESFELATSATVDGDRDDTAVTIRVTGPVYGALTDPDHPVVSAIATGLAVELNTPVTVEVREGDQADGIVRCEWETPDAKQSG